MKSNLLRIFFEWTLITSLLMSVGFFVWFYRASRGVRVCQSQIAVGQTRYQNNHLVIGRLLAECQEYAKTNPDMARILDSLKVQTATPTAPAAPAAAASKPKAK